MISPVGISTIFFFACQGMCRAVLVSGMLYWSVPWTGEPRCGLSLALSYMRTKRTTYYGSVSTAPCVSDIPSSVGLISITISVQSVAWLRTLNIVFSPVPELSECGIIFSPSYLILIILPLLCLSLRFSFPSPMILPLLLLFQTFKS